jgi:bifunctional DNase/RNase
MGSNTLVEADIWTVAQTEQGNVILVRPKHAMVAVPVFVGALEAQSILIGLGKVDMPRPLTHDLMLSVLSRLAAALLRIEIYDLKEGTFFARLIVESPQGELVFDARPSDAMALAVRCNAGVYIAESIIEDVGVPVDMIRDASQERPGSAGEEGAATPGFERSELAAGDAFAPAPAERLSAADAERIRLQRELDQAIAEENYELAAALRDRLKGLDSKA